MTAQRPHLISSETFEKPHILIIDKSGIIAEALVEKLKEQFFVVLVSGRELGIQGSLTHIYYGKKIPMIPDLRYKTILTFFQGEKTTLDIMPMIAKKAQEINSRHLFITSVNCMDKMLRTFLNHKLFEDTKEIVYGEEFGKEGFEGNALTEYIHEVRMQNKIKIPGNGLQKIYPILFDDLIDSLVTIAFAMPKNPKTTFVLPKHGFTHLSVARAFQKLDPLVKISFRDRSNKEIEYNLSANQHYFFTSYNLLEKLKKIDLSKKKLLETKFAGSRAKKNKFPKKIKPSRKYSFIILVVLFFLLPLLLQILLLFTGGVFFVESFKNLEKNDIPLAKNYNLFSKSAFASANFITQNVSGINPILFFQKDPIRSGAQVGMRLSEIEEDFIDSISIMKNIYEGKSSDFKNDFQQALAKAKSGIISLEKLKAEGNLPSVVSQKMNKFGYPMSVFENTVDTLPDLLGFNQRRKYLILFQNNMELRPGGGFIGSYAVVDILNGKPGNLQIHDVYDADGKMSIHVEPPFALRRYLGASHLFLRDSNNSADFVSNAAQAQSMLELETGEKVDGVIAIDTDFVKALIEAFGPLYIYDYNEIVTGDNFFILTETHAEKDFFPGSTQKKDFVRAVYSALEAKISQEKNIPWDNLLQKISGAVLQKHLLFAVPKMDSQKVFTVNNLSSSLQVSRDRQDNGFLDFLGINEANLGMNKTNYYLKRVITQKIVIDDKGAAREKVEITYENTSRKTSVFGGDYKNYLRFILPDKTKLDTVELNNAPIATTSAVTDSSVYSKKGFVPPTQLEVEKTQSGGKTVYGFLVMIPSGTSQKISIGYELENAINLTSAVFNYDLYVFKQPGAGSDLYSFSITYPKAFQPIEGQGGMSDVGGKLLYEDKLDSDKNIVLKFSRK